MPLSSALTVAAAATLVVPIAVRRMIDAGFSVHSTGTINSYFGAMIGVVGVLALASGTRYYLVNTLGERVVADLRSAVFDISPVSTRASSTARGSANCCRVSPPTRRN